MLGINDIKLLSMFRHSFIFRFLYLVAFSDQLLQEHHMFHHNLKLLSK